MKQKEKAKVQEKKKTEIKEKQKMNKQNNLNDNNTQNKANDQKNIIETEETKIEEKENILGTEKIGKILRKFSIPCIISLLVSSLYNIVDQIFIGQGVGYLGNAATNIVFPLTVISMAFSFLIGDGAAANLSLCLGKKDEESASKGVGNSILVVSILSIIFLAVSIIFQDSLLKLFGVTPESYQYAKGYMFYIALGLPFFMITNALNSIIRADGSPKYAMASMLIGAIINLILDPIAIFILRWGVEGAAIATVIGQVVSGIVSLSYLRRFKSIKVNKQSMKIHWKTLKNVILLGISSFITEISITIVIITLNQLLVKYGAESKYGSDIPLSALGIVMKVNQIINSIVLGIAVGAQPIWGFNYGAKKYDRVIKTLRITIMIAVLITAIGTVILQLCPQVIINLFGQENDLYNEFARKCFKIFLMLIVFNSIQITSGIFMQAIGKSVKSALISLSRQILFLIPALLIWGFLNGIEGILYAGPTADFLAFLMAGTLMFIEIRKIKKLEKKENVVEEQVEA